VGTLLGFDNEVVHGPGMRKFTDGRWMHPKFPSDRCVGQPLSAKFLHAGIISPQPLDDLLLGKRLRDFRWLQRGRRLWRRLGETCPVSVDRLFNGLAQVLPQMKSVRNLNGLRRPFACTFGIPTSPVAANNFDFWVLA
jgi:hypothetical protein